MGGPLRLPGLLCVLLSLSRAGAQGSQACNPRCPPNSECVNATACRCKPGFASSSTEIFTDPLEICDDINECVPPMKVSCGKLADCQNVEGSYYCMCSPGYELRSGGTNFTNASENTCQDVDECSSGQHQCHQSTICTNTLGSYQCHCRPGWELIPGSVNDQNSTICKVMPFFTWSLPPEVHSQSLSRFFDKVNSLHKDFKPVAATDTIQSLIGAMDELLKAPGDVEDIALPVRHQVATQLLLGLEQSLRTLAGSLPEGPFTYRSPSDTELSLVNQKPGNGNVTLGQSHARIHLDWATATGAGNSSTGTTVVGILSNPNMGKLLVNASLVLDPEKGEELQKAHEGPFRGARVQILSPVNSVFLTNKDTEKLASPVTFAFSHDGEISGKRKEVICAFWKIDSNKSGHWDTTGCWKLGSGDNSTTCRCNHLSSFAILMAHYDIQDWKLELITKVGLSLSLVCLLLCILTFLLVRPIQSSRTTVHLHLCVCLFVGSAIFLAGIEKETPDGEAGPRCRLVAGLLHYCFLAAFCWMSLEGLVLYFLVVRVFHGQGLSTRWLCLIGYGVPLLIVAISAATAAATASEGYVGETYCWLSRKHGFLWSFVGPLAFIILCNAVIFVITVWRLTQKFSEINPDLKKLRKARVLTVTAIAQLFVLGCTWVFGLFLFEPYSSVLTYIFTILNCLQGLFLYVLLCLLNKKVREEYRKWACMVAGSKYSEFASSTTGTSHNQTRELRPSESGM
ncbi:adhesion G protein-coupled receptor E5 isoform 4-T4 [Callospermophilus lateralis]|uniref:adhesion G protein-coupled receptor E5 isoform X4 n=1 Tax=Callospermophilus lateralis TaxID=76772 RepID=UPI004053ADB4